MGGPKAQMPAQVRAVLVRALVLVVAKQLALDWVPAHGKRAAIGVDAGTVKSRSVKVLGIDVSTSAITFRLEAFFGIPK